MIATNGRKAMPPVFLLLRGELQKVLGVLELRAGHTSSDRIRQSLRVGETGPSVSLDEISRQAAAGEVHLGDLVLAHGVCVEEAKAQGKSLSDHLSHLVVHGVLHLLGRDHEIDEEAEEMEEEERSILASLGIVSTHLLQRAEPTLRLLCEAMLVATVAGLVAVALLLCIPGLSGQRAIDLVHRVPIVGSTLARVLSAVRAYRDRKSLLAAAAAVTPSEASFMAEETSLACCADCSAAAAMELAVSWSSADAAATPWTTPPTVCSNFSARSSSMLVCRARSSSRSRWISACRSSSTRAASATSAFICSSLR